MTENTSRLLDANINRVREGLRVCEEIARFLWEREDWFGALRGLRHQITRIAVERLDLERLVQARDADKDIGRGIDSLQTGIPSVKDLFLRNLQRTKEGLRVLEEFSHEIDPVLRQVFQTLRYDVYSLERDVVSHWNTHRNELNCPSSLRHSG
ncbi:MAG: hypothetical protein HYS56_04035 [Candidatus Omnitrophica bacterium]|nr:hypothetical protein [Candidatus Omnitrophota bacterium]